MQHDEQNTSGTSRGKRTPTAPYGAWLVINSMESESEDDMPQREPARMLPKTSMKGSGKGKGKGKGKNKLSKLWIAGKKRRKGNK